MKKQSKTLEAFGKVALWVMEKLRWWSQGVQFLVPVFGAIVTIVICAWLRNQQVISLFLYVVILVIAVTLVLTLVGSALAATEQRIKDHQAESEHHRP